METEPDSWLSDLATALHNVAITYAGNGRYGEAIGAMEEAVDPRSRQAEQIPARFGRELAESEQLLADLRAMAANPLMAVPLQFFGLLDKGIAIFRHPAERLLREAHRNAPSLVEALWKQATGRPLPPGITD